MQIRSVRRFCIVLSGLSGAVVDMLTAFAQSLDRWRRSGAEPAKAPRDHTQTHTHTNHLTPGSHSGSIRYHSNVCSLAILKKIN